MCGITGIIDFSKSDSLEKRNESVRSMNRALLHRGPDEDGFFENENCALAMSRLSIIDLSGGRQPIFNDAGDIGIFQNGEIYNFRELKAELEVKGYQFKSDSDTEVLVKMYEAYGREMLPKLRGMFALCVFDLRRKMFFLARDRFGEKPLFYHFSKGIFSFSSELKSLLENREIPRRLNADALPYYFRTSLLPEPLTMFDGILSLPPGHFAEISEGGISIEKYFEIEYNINENLKTEEDAEALIRPVLEQAVQRQTVADVPLGAFLSGGIDSSTIVAMLQKKASKPIQTFTARFETESFDESTIARKVAEHCGTNHHELVIPNYDFTEDIFWKIIEHVGQPFRDSSAIPTFLLTQEIRKHVTVALSGDGGDELFGGYDLFQWYQKIVSLRKIPSPIRSAASFGLQMAGMIPGVGDFSKIRQLRRGIDTSLADIYDIPIELNAFFSESEIQKLLQKSERDFYTFLKTYPPKIRNGSPLRKIMYYRTQHTLPGNMLVKVDRMSMANSLEVRAPFLDADLFDAAAQLPDRFLIKNGKGKHLIRKIMEKELPSEVFNHPKSGFNIPLHDYRNSAFKSLAHRLFFEENPLPDLFEPVFLKRIFDEGFSIQKDSARQSVFQASHRLWMMMQLLGWAERFEVEGIDNRYEF